MKANSIFEQAQNIMKTNHISYTIKQYKAHPRKKHKLYKCSLDEMQCKETCHGNLELKEKCPNCKIIKG